MPNAITSSRFWIAAVVLVLSLADAQSAGACAVCFGDPDAAMTQSINKGIIVLLGVVAGVQIFFVAVFFSIRRRSRQLTERKSQFQVLRGGAR